MKETRNFFLNNEENNLKGKDKRKNFERIPRLGFIFLYKNDIILNQDELRKKREQHGPDKNLNENQFRLNYEKNLKTKSIRTDRKVSKRV